MLLQYMLFQTYELITHKLKVCQITILYNMINPPGPDRVGGQYFLHMVSVRPSVHLSIRHKNKNTF